MQRAASLVSSKSSLKAGTTGYYIKAQVLLLLAKIRNCLRKQSIYRKLRSVREFEVFLISICIPRGAMTSGLGMVCSVN